MPNQPSRQLASPQPCRSKRGPCWFSTCAGRLAARPHPGIATAMRSKLVGRHRHQRSMTFDDYVVLKANVRKMLIQSFLFPNQV